MRKRLGRQMRLFVFHYYLLLYLRERRAAPLQRLCKRGCRGWLPPLPNGPGHPLLTYGQFTLREGDHRNDGGGIQRHTAGTETRPYFIFGSGKQLPYKDCANGDVGDGACDIPRADVGIRPYVITRTSNARPYIHSCGTICSPPFPLYFCRKLWYN